MMGSQIDPAERRRNMATVGIMANARKDYGKAEAVQTRLIKEAKAADEPMEVALAIYNLGNTYLGAKDYEAAVETLTTAADGCCHHGFDELAPLVFCNLGVALYHCGEEDAAFKALRVSRDMFQAQKNLPGEAHVVDCFAKCNQALGHEERAEQAWQYALHLYDQISNPKMQDVRVSGRTDILQKLDRHGYSHGD